MLTPKAVKIAKFITTVIGAGLTLLQKNNSGKILDERIAKKVNEELEKRSI